MSLKPIEDRPIRGPRAAAVAQGGWPMSNLKLDGCKHDIYGGDEELLDAGHAVPCAKCGATLIAPELAKHLADEVWDVEEGEQ